MSTQTDQLAERLTQTAAEVVIAKKLWQVLIPLPLPDDFQFALWLRLHCLETLAYAIEETAKKFRRVDGMSQDQAVRFLSRCANNREQPGYARLKSSCNQQTSSEER